MILEEATYVKLTHPISPVLVREDCDTDPFESRCGYSNLKYDFPLRVSNMCLCGMSRAYPEFYFTEEDIKKFAGKLRNATKYLLAGRREQEALSKFIKNDL